MVFATRLLSLVAMATCGVCLAQQPLVTATVDQRPSAAKDSSSVVAARKLKNAPVPSAGCGKDLGDFKSGTYTITSAGLSRQYTIDIPANYDKNTPHRLIFAMHMMGGSMQTMVENRFYRLKDYAEKENIPVIFVAPQGYTDRFPWRVGDDKDHIFFADGSGLWAHGSGPRVGDWRR